MPDENAVRAVPEPARADIQQPSARLAGRQPKQRILHRLSRQVQRAHFVPVGAFAAKTLGGDARPLRQHAGGLAAVGLQDRVIGGQAGDQVSGERPFIPARQGEPNVRPLPHPVQQPAIAQEFEVPGEPRLRLAEDFREFHHAETAPGGEREKPKPGGLRDGAQAGEEAFHAACLT